jgi:hypothetical protein
VLKRVEDRPEISCTLRALSAVTGLSYARVHAEIRAAALDRFGVDIGSELLPGYNMDHWMPALLNLGWEHEERDLRDFAFEQRPVIDDWMRQDTTEGFQLIMCTNSDAESQTGHVFAFCEGTVVDEYTGGEPVPCTDVPADYKQFRVKRIIKIRRRLIADGLAS